MDDAIERYPTDRRRSAAMPLLHLWQEEFGFISVEGVNWIAAKLALQPINILELVSPSNVFVLILRRWSDAQFFHGHVRSGVVVRKIVLRVCGSHVTDRCAEQLSECLKIIRGSS